MLASVLSAAGYRTGLYTSPHLIDVTERIRIDGVRIPEAIVSEFIERYGNTVLEIGNTYMWNKVKI